MTPRPVHASDVRNAQRCRRLAVLGRRTERQPFSRALAGRLGTATHSVIQRYVATGELPDDTASAHDRIALELVPHVPAGALGCEVPFTVDWHGYALRGSIDLVAPGVVVDWKTISDWAHRLQSLAGNPQAAWYSYAYDVCAGEPPELRWVYVHTKSLQTRPLIGRVARDAVDAFGSVIEWLTDQDVRDVDPLTIPGNRSECSRYGGCTFRKLCGPEDLGDRLDRVSP